MTNRADHFHARYKILDLFRTCLKEAGIAGLKVREEQVYPVAEENLPLIFMNIVSETSSFVSFESLQADLEISVVLCVRKTALAEQDIAWFSGQIQTKILTYDALLKKTNLITPTGYLPETDTEGSQPVWITQLLFSVNYTIVPAEPWNLEEK